MMQVAFLFNPIKFYFMKKTFVLTLCLLCTMFAMAQKEEVEFYNLSWQKNQFYDNEVIALRDNLMSKFAATGRIKVIHVDQEKLRTSSQTQNRYGISGSANSLVVEQKYNEYSKKYEYTATIKYDLRLYDLQTGSPIMTENYSEVGVSTVSSNDARARAIQRAGDGVKVFVEKAFPIKGEIVALAGGSDKKAKSVYVNLGTDMGITKGQKFVVYTLVDIAGEMSEKEVGKLTVSNVMSGSRSECKVNTGGDAIMKALNAGDMLIVKTEASFLEKFDNWLSH